MCEKEFNIYLFLCHCLHLLEHCALFFLACSFGLRDCQVRCAINVDSGEHYVNEKIRRK
jgi:hypothetical protein